ncbi:Purple acid phosphatase 7, partial [Durusdinium trenchii]
EVIVKPKRLGSYLVIGDWGWDENAHGNLKSRHCQQLVADAMHQEFESLGDVQFVINVGDSFYPDGVANKSDAQWELKWRQVYSSRVRSVPWYSVYGNHDLHADPCACSDDLAVCAQVNDDENNLAYFFMPNHSWYRHHAEMDLEVIALDLNYYQWGNQTCPHTNCPDACR